MKKMHIKTGEKKTKAKMSGTLFFGCNRLFFRKSIKTLKHFFYKHANDTLGIVWWIPGSLPSSVVQSFVCKFIDFLSYFLSLINGKKNIYIYSVELYFVTGVQLKLRHLFYFNTMQICVRLPNVMLYSLLLRERTDNILWYRISATFIGVPQLNLMRS